MDRKEFQKLVVRTNSKIDKIELTQRNKTILENTLQSLITITEILDIYKKHIFYGRDIDHEALGELLNASITYNYEALFLNQDELHSPNKSNIELDTIDLDTNIFHALLGTITEHGELAIALSKGINNGNIDLINVCEELGDSDWYKALFYETTGIEWEKVQSMIINKLEIRYKDKIFSEEEAFERDLDTERALLEESMLEAVEKFENN